MRCARITEEGPIGALDTALSEWIARAAPPTDGLVPIAFDGNPL